jgi:REP element-mobilizing transposase RayT
MSTLEYKLFYQRHLPHIQPPGATLFITFRLAGSIPAEVLKQLALEAESRDARLSRMPDPKERAIEAYREHRRMFGLWDRALDTTKSGPFWLRDPQIAELVPGSMHHCDGKTYDLVAYCVMPNHVHVIFTPLPKPEGGYHAMSAIMHSLKRYTARESNLLLGREGQFWQHENYDHVVRDEAELNRIIRYVLNNPAEAGLVERWEDWQWSYCKYPS